MRVIFLDFDGVLNNEGHSYWMDKFSNIESAIQYKILDNVNLSNLSWVIEACDSKEDPIKIAITSTWQHYFSIEELRDILKEFIDPSKVIDVVKQCKLSSQRGHDITYWLENNKVSKYAVIDDKDDAISFFHSESFFKTNHRDGFTFQKATEVANHFGIINKMPIFLF